MKAIEVNHLTRRFTTHLKQPGLGGAVRGLFKREYKTKIAVNDVSFSIEKGEFVGFLGPNGAGKTTTLKMLAGVLHPTSGSAQVLGYVPWQRQAAFQRRFSLVLGQKNQLWWDLPALDSFELNRDIYDVDKRVFKDKVAELSELLDIKDLLSTPVRKLSLGERMKCEIAASLLHAPEVLFLDEPTIGLDVISQVRIREFLRDYNLRTGITVILTSHYMADIEALCERVIVIDGGQAVYDGALRDLVARAAGSRLVRVKLNREIEAQDLEFARTQGHDVEQEGREVRVLVPREDVPKRLSALLSHLPALDVAVEDIEVEQVIRDLFTQTKNDKLAAEAAA